ncbi:MAG: iron-sulfur cluster assembly scaffold protein [Candidatus Lokiarchaeota archaeon]|nr:iron-sulfur cluster assembly scaffold protein [Candidatus Lokiarchaeota archaeon]
MGNDNEFDDFVKKLQAEIDKKEQEDYSDIVREEYHNPSNVGKLSEDLCNGFGRYTSEVCGDSVLMYIHIEEDHIENIKFRTDGCGVTTAVASKLSKMVKGKKIKDAMSITPEELTDALGGLPDEHLHCPKLAITALDKAIKNFQESKSE